jgi:hypothetical protein
MNKIKIPITTAIISAIIFYFEISSNFSIGEVINRYFPCEQNPMNSFPCFGIYDIYFMFLLIGIFIISLIIIGFQFYKAKKS